MRLMFSRRSILDKATLLDKTCLVVQSAIMESNCLTDTELTLSATTENESPYKWMLGLAHSSSTVTKKLSVSKLHNFTLSLHLYEFFISPVL